MRGIRAVTIGHTILLGPHIEDSDLEHELIHVKQFMQMPFVFPVMYAFEFIKKGYKNNKYEQEAYRKSGNVYKDK